MAISVLIADDHKAIRSMLGRLLARQPGIRVVGYAADGVQAIIEATRLRPDVVVMDISMPRMTGISATRELQHEQPQIKVVILSGHATSEHVNRAVLAGAHGYVLKNTATQDIIDAVRAVHAGKRFLSGTLAAAMNEEKTYASTRGAR